MDLHHPSGVSNRRPIWLVSLFTFFVSVSAHASLISYDLIDLGSSQYRYEYTFTNDGSLPGGAAIELIDIAFDPVLYDEGSLNIVSASGLSADWDQNILTANLGDPVYFDIYALSGGLSSGQFLSGFAIEFSWLGGAGGPGAQDYTILDPNNFSVLASGTTGACSSWRLGPCTDTYRFPRIIPGASTPSFPPTPLRLKAALQRT